MMMIFFSFFIFSDVDSLMSAKTSEQIETYHKKEVHMQVLYQRCEIELREKWIPRTCFLWLNLKTFSPSDKKKMEIFLNNRCVDALSYLKNDAFPVGFFKNLKKGPCATAAQQSYLDQQYQIQKKAPLRLIEQHLKVGREIESVMTDESEKDYKN
jgi:hypothetical protein